MVSPSTICVSSIRKKVYSGIGPSVFDSCSTHGSRGSGELWRKYVGRICVRVLRSQMGTIREIGKRKNDRQWKDLIYLETAENCGETEKELDYS